MRDAHELGLRAVNLVAQNPAARAAVRGHALAARRAAPAGADAGDQHPVTGFECRHGLADTVHNADAFVAEDGAGFAGGHIAFEDVQVGAANRRARELDDGIAGQLDARLGTVIE